MFRPGCHGAGIVAATSGTGTRKDRDWIMRAGHLPAGRLNIQNDNQNNNYDSSFVAYPIVFAIALGYGSQCSAVPLSLSLALAGSPGRWPLAPRALPFLYFRNARSNLRGGWPWLPCQQSRAEQTVPKSLPPRQTLATRLRLRSKYFVIRRICF